MTVQAYVEKAVEAGVVRLNEEIEEFTTDIRMIVIGNVFGVVCEARESGL